MKGFEAFAAAVDYLNEAVGRIVAWLLLPMAATGFGVAALRYVAGVGYPWLSESFVWLNGAIVMVASAWVLKRGGHVRVDLLYRWLGPAGRAWIDLIGVWLFLMPMVLVLAHLSWPIVRRSWLLVEASPTPDGLPVLYLLKTTMLVFCALVALQGLAMTVRCLATIRRRGDGEGP
jgi:TRAP-type mannitol/chloroaromatic compound transport system permease small subunit